MPLFRTACVAPLALIALAAPATARETKTCPTVTEAGVTAQFDRFNAAWATGSPDEVVKLFAPDATLLATVSNAERTTPAAIRAYFVDFLKGKPVGRIETSTVLLDCTRASRTGNWVVNMANANGERVDVPARYSFLYSWDGKEWKIQHLHSSVRPAPVQAGK